MTTTRRASTDRTDYLGHRARLKERYVSSGLSALQDYELLELLLSYALPFKDVKPLAKELIKRFGSFNGVLDAEASELQEIKNIKQHTAVLLRLIRDIAARYTRQDVAVDRDLIASPHAAETYLRTLLKGRPEEEFYALFLDNGNRFIASALVHTGTVNRSAVYPRTIAKNVLKYNAAGVIIAHNHPGGALTPSDDDIKATEAVRRALETVEATLLDHIIIAGNNSFSWKEHGLL